MRTFTIDSENNITVYASMQEAKTSDQTDAVLFTTQEELARSYFKTLRKAIMKQAIWNNAL